ncbi:MAG: hypothetical protein C4308_02130 [Chitinophagaceae bacterium]
MNDERKDADQSHKHPLPQAISTKQKIQNTEAYQQAEEDMLNDAELSAHSPNDDLDERKSARLGEDTYFI